MTSINLMEDPNPVTTDQYDNYVFHLQELADSIVTAKRRVYTQDSDNTLRNFQQIAQMVPGTSPGQVLAIYLAKQAVSVINLLAAPNINDSEKDTRFADLLNYTYLAYTMWASGRHLNYVVNS